MLTPTAPLASARLRILSPWRALVVALVFLALGLAACQGGQATQPPPGGETTAPGAALPSEAAGVRVNRITYVSPEGHLFTINPDGGDARQLTGDIQQARSMGRFLAQGIDTRNIFAWPTWSPDGTKLAASRIQVSGNQSQISIQVIDIATGRARTIFNNDPSVLSVVAQTAPHYLYWAPDSRSLAFVAPTRQGLVLFVEDTETPTVPAAVQTGAPIYFHWAEDSNSILFHTVRDLKLSQQPFSTSPRELVADVTGFRVPALSPDGRLMAYTVASGSGGSLIVAETADPSAARQVLEVGALSAFMWSPDGAELAVVDQEDPNSPLFQRLRVVSTDGATRTIAEDPLISFYWSPNSERIAWVTLEPGNEIFDWNVAPRSGTPVRQLFRFQPSLEVFDMLVFFDQFARSHSPWSPDSSNLVVAGARQPPFSRGNGQTSTTNQVFVLDVADTAAHREIASGNLAFWSWN